MKEDEDDKVEGKSVSEDREKVEAAPKTWPRSNLNKECQMNMRKMKNATPPPENIIPPYKFTGCIKATTFIPTLTVNKDVCSEL